MTDAKFDVAPAIACPFCDAYRARVEKAEFEANVETEIADGAFMRMKDAESEVAALKHDIERHVQIAADLATENEELRQSLRGVLELCKVSYGASHEDVADFLAFTGRAHAALGDLK